MNNYAADSSRRERSAKPGEQRAGKRHQACNIEVSTKKALDSRADREDLLKIASDLRGV